MNPKPVPTPLVPLSQIIAGAAEGQEPVPGFVGQVEGTDYVVTAVLERTAVLEVPGDRWGDRRTARLDGVLVDEAAITWRPKPPPASYAAWRGRPRPAVSPAAQRVASDERAPAEQARPHAAEAAAVRLPARPLTAVGRLGPTASSTAREARPVDRRVRPPDRSAPDRRRATPVARAQTAEPIRLLADQLEHARARIAELEAERERTLAAQRRLIRRARAAVARRVA